jgi:hypothetical protein
VRLGAIGGFVSRDLEAVRGDLLFKMKKLAEFKHEVVIQHRAEGGVWVVEKRNPVNVVVVLRADEWDMFLNLKGVPGGNKNQHTKGSNQTGLNAPAEGDGQEDPRRELRHDER